MTEENTTNGTEENVDEGELSAQELIDALQQRLNLLERDIIIRDATILKQTKRIGELEGE